MTSIALAALLGAAPAWACGGFFCNNDAPVDQSGEQIVFAVDDEAGTVTVHVQITYAGTDPHDFAWVVPVSTQPELSLSTDRLFQELAWRYAPRFDLRYVDEGDCNYGGNGLFNWGQEYALSAEDAAGSTAPPSAGGVVVVEESTVGPYETAILLANDTAALLEWLQTNGYDLPDTLEPVLTPYTATGSYFVALRLSADRDTGDLAPLAMTYPGDKASIPIQLTSIAATPDMRLTAYVLGEHRAVPENYLHVQINEVAIDWEAYGSNYEDVITQAADEAGGQAFATDYAGATEGMAGVLYADGRYDLDALAAATDPIDFMNQLIGQGFPADATVLDILTDYLPLPDALAAQGVQPSDYYNCLECYAEHVPSSFDSAGAAAELETFVVAPLEQAQAMFDAHPTMSRLTSSISPIEMTVDPMFVFNPDMGDVSGIWSSKLVTECGNGSRWDEAPMRLELPSGLEIHLPSREWLEDQGLTIREFLDDLTDVSAIVIEATGASGQPETLTDHRGALAAEVDDLNTWVDDLMQGGGCGCAVAPGSGAVGAWGLAAVLGLVYRRRRS